VVAITGASGACYGTRLLAAMRDQAGWETHLVTSRAGYINLATELGLDRRQLGALADVVHDERDVGAAIASGSFRTEGMVIAPCSARTLACVASGTGDNLIARAADVVLKERRRLVLLVRETPLHLGHLRNMLAATEMGAICMPPVPAFYAQPATLTEMVDHTIGRVLDLFGIDAGLAYRWAGTRESSSGRTPA
jgi:polyprenyl P-hydroxybenzoate/phenylacrylic acid decarboxylase-like protein